MNTPDQCNDNISLSSLATPTIDEASNRYTIGRTKRVFALKRAKFERLTKCKICRNPFKKLSLAHKVCSPECAIEFNAKEKEKKRQREYLKNKVSLRTKREWLKLAQTVVNQYVRLRDEKDGCISCNRPVEWHGQWHASHFRSVGAASAVRFNLWNIHKSCSICNNWKSGNLSDYEPRLRAKIGDEKVDWLRSQNQPVTHSIEFLQRLIKVFKKKSKLLQNKKNYVSQVVI